MSTTPTNDGGPLGPTDNFKINISKKDGRYQTLITGDEGVEIKIEQPAGMELKAWLGASYMVVEAIFDEPTAQQVMATFQRQLAARNQTTK